METEPKTYEINYLLIPLVAEEKLGEGADALRKIIEDNGGFIVGEERAKMQRLAYKIKKFETAYFGWFRFSAKPEAIAAVKNSFEKNEKVIRSLIIEAGKENLPQFSARKTAGAKRTEDVGSEEPKKEIKPEQIDEKLEEILKEAKV